MSNKNNIIDKIKKNIQLLKPHYISFDCFDTLLCRHALLPTDLFKILELRVNKHFHNKYKHFAQIRTIIEKQLREFKKKHYISEVTLDEIYDYLIDRTNISKKDVAQIKKIELDIELQYSQERKSIKEVYDYCISKDYNIIVISDTYFSNQFIQKLLAHNGYNNFYKIYTSSTNRLTKGSGDLFKYIFNDLNIKNDEIYHIGDNQYADYQKAKENSIEATHINKGIDNFFANPINQNLWSPTQQLPILTKVSLGQIINNLYDDNIITGKMNIFSNKYSTLGYYLGYTIFSLALWLLKLAEKYKVKTINLVQRDGYLLLHIIPLICKYYPYKVKLNYIPLSRALSFPLYLNSKFDYLDINYILPCKMSINNFLKQRMLIDDYETNQDVLRILEKHSIKNLKIKTDSINLTRLSLDLAPISLKYAKKKRRILTKYLQKNIDEEENILIYDSGYSARPQFMLESAFPNNNIIGAYFTSFNKAESTLCNKNNIYNFAPYFNNYRQNFETIILESIMQDINVESIIGISPNLKPIYEQPNNSKKILQINKKIDELQKNIIKYATEFMDIVKQDIELFTLFPYDSTRIYEYIHNDITKEDTALISNISYISNPVIGNSLYLERHFMLKQWRRKEIYE